MSKVYKTCLRYPGGKSRAVKFLFQRDHIPNDLEYFMDPFVGGGSCALAFARERPDVPIWINDKYYNLYCFWKTLQEQPAELQEQLFCLKSKAQHDPDKIESKHRELFEEAKKFLAIDEGRFAHLWTPLMRAVYFYVANKCSFSGLGESSGFSFQASQQNFTVQGISNLAIYSNLIQDWLITNLDYTEILNSAESKNFVFMDPPYDINSFLYGKKGNMHNNFDHDELLRRVDGHPAHIMITYNSSDKIKEMYGGWTQTEWDLTYTMRSTGTYNKDQSKRKELMLTNYAITEGVLDEY